MTTKERAIKFYNFLENKYNLRETLYRNSSEPTYERFRDIFISDLIEFVNEEEIENRRLMSFYRKLKSAIRTLLFAMNENNKYKNIQKEALKIAEDRLKEIDGEPI